MRVLPLIHIGAPVAPVTLLPSGPMLHLPAEDVVVTNSGRVFIYGNWLIAVGVSSQLFFVMGTSSARQVPLNIKEQLVGYLAACGAAVMRVPIRFDAHWHDPKCLSRTVFFWTRRFIEGLSICLGTRAGFKGPPLALPIGVLANQARCEWEWVLAIFHALSFDFPNEIPMLERLLCDIAHAWELHWALLLRDAERFDEISQKEWLEVVNCDRSWATVVHNYLENRGYRILPNTMARLL